MLDVFNQIVNIPLDEIFVSLNLTNLFEVGIIIVFVSTFYIKYVKGTQSERFVKGIVILLATLLFSKLLILAKLQILGRFIESIITLVLLGLVVVFQPELRRFLGYLGQTGFFNKSFFTTDSQVEKTDISEELTEAVKYLSKSKTGALMVIQNTPGSADYFEVGTKINGIISTELLLTIFHPNTALHDGATVITGDKVISAGVLLPLTEDPKLSWKYGTRHRAAIGMTEVSDAACIVVSEESGDVSIAQEGLLQKCETIEEFRAKLENILGHSPVTSKKASILRFNLNNWFSKDIKKFPNLLNKQQKNQTSNTQTDKPAG